MELISCLDALARGKTRFFTGEACKYGHVAERMVSNGSCVDCLNARRKARRDNYANVKAWRKANPEKVNEQARRYRAKHPETSAKAKAKYREANLAEIRESDREAKARWRKANPEKQKERMARYWAKKEAERVALAGRPRPTACDLCGTDAIGQICFDHCHATGKFRGWLCDRCNKVLGLIKDNTELLTSMLRYLQAA